jgi:hypothetical protein
MSSRDRAFSKLDREELQDAIEANNQFAKKWILKREAKLQFLEESIDPLLIQEAQNAFHLIRKLDFESQQDLVRVLWDLQGTLSAWYQVLQRPQNVEVAAKLISEELEKGLNLLANAKVLTRRETSSDSP